MTDEKTPPPLSLEERKQLFLPLVGAQDGGLTVAESREWAGEKFGVSEQLVREVERQGLDGQWPPLE